MKFCNFQSMKVLSTIYAWSEDINPLDDFPLIHMSMTVTKASTKTIFSTCNSFPWDLRLSIKFCNCQSMKLLLTIYACN